MWPMENGKAKCLCSIKLYKCEISHHFDHYLAVFVLLG